MNENTLNPAQTSPAISNWLFITAGFVFAMIIIGAITRLTESGLSMVEWRPLIGTLPPMSEAEWTRVFELYKETPEYQKKNFWMGIDDFKYIFFWEWFHRFWGRLIGLVYAVPFFYFLLRGQIPAKLKPSLIALLILGGAQGLMGWYMVQSGLIDQPAVSHYRLAAHLSLAFLIFALLIWTGLRARGTPYTPYFCLFRHGCATLFVLCVTILWGAFVAGLDAGLLYNEFPNMGATLVPPDMWHLQPAWMNIFENEAAVQFTHRWIAMFSALIVLSFAVRGMTQTENKGLYALLGFTVLLQVGLGIVTLLSGVWIVAAVLHQAGAAILLGLMTVCLYKSRPGQKIPE